MPDFKTCYLNLLDNNELEERAKILYQKLEKCQICPNNCNVNRLKGEKGLCGTLDKLIISSYGAHFGEESPLVGNYGSGTVFFTNCNLKCVFCQNYEISQLGEGYELTPEFLASIFLALQENKCHNINLVSPTHQIPGIVMAIYIAAKEGLKIPIVYNAGGYDSMETLKLLDGIIDIYMPDFKYWDKEIALKLSKVKEYPHFARKALKEMHRQVGDLVVDRYGIAQRGVIVRHLVLPENQAGSEEIVRFISEEISNDTYINIIDQYRPCFNAGKYPEISRRISRDEFKDTIGHAKNHGLLRLDKDII